MTTTSRVNRWRLLLLWSAAALFSLGPPAYLAAVWIRQRSAIQELTKLGHAVNHLSRIRESHLSRNPVIPADFVSMSKLHWSARYQSAFDSRIRHLVAEIPDLSAQNPRVRLFSPFPDLDLHIYIPDPRTGPNQAKAITTIATDQAVKCASQLTALHSLRIESSRAGSLFDRTWAIRELSVQNLGSRPATKDTWDNLALERVDRSMPRLHFLSLSGIEWDEPVNFPKQGFNNLVTLLLQRAATERFKLCHRSGLKYAQMDGAIGELIVSDCPDLERLFIGSLGEQASIAIQHLPRLKVLYVGYTSSLVLADLPELETAYLGGSIRATHLKRLTEMPKLKRVSLNASKFDGAMVDQLLKLKSMEELYLSLGKVRGNLARLAAHPTLQVLQFHLHGIQGMGMSEKDIIAEFGLKALMANGRIRVIVFKELLPEGALPEEDNEQPPQYPI